jgi:hypothetical protein
MTAHLLSRRIAAGWCLAATIALAGCTSQPDTAPTNPDTPDLSLGAPAPGPLTSIDLGANHALRFWPFTSSRLEADPGNDPVNVIFTGRVDVRDLRAALMALPAGRGAPFEFVTCTWTDAIGGDIQGTYAKPGGWEGSAIQVACGDYGPMPRFHLRFFDAGQAILGGAHFEIQIPGTDQHQVLNWELAEQLVAYDVVRTGLVKPGDLAQTDQINPSPWRTIPDFIYNLLPSQLLPLIAFGSGGPAPVQPVTQPVPISSDGMATILPVTGHYAGPITGSTQSFTINFDQGIPKPFCAAKEPLVYVNGPVFLEQNVTVGRHGQLMSAFSAHGQLQVVPLDPATGQPNGAPYSANVVQRQRTIVTDWMNSAESFFLQQLRSANREQRGFQLQELWLGSRGPDRFKEVTRCGTDH